MTRYSKRQELEERMARAKTKRDFDLVVECFRRVGVFSAEDRAALEALAEEQIQRFATEAERSRGVRVKMGRVHQSFQNVLRGR